ncbi:hypothetical protein [Cohnella lupini]|uniref:Uncharacterized protein n=1 Tax=Cohnella lupini TaxID=1294267 RepID=A0A3D9IBY5_9BACL|nr:hypothetical protein [Cohnella lupini]RED59282.1 hypothetical protein DFP95_107121 [Cohnella lupini]
MTLPKKKKFLYRDPKYGFLMRLPCRWRNYIVVKRTKRISEAKYAVFFLFKYKGKVYEEALTILVYRMPLKRWREYYEGSPIQFLAQRSGLVFAYSTPSELPDDFLNESKEDYDYKKYGRPIRLLKRMVNADVPNIVNTFRLAIISGKR